VKIGVTNGRANLASSVKSPSKFQLVLQIFLYLLIESLKIYSCSWFPPQSQQSSPSPVSRNSRWRSRHCPFPGVWRILPNYLAFQVYRTRILTALQSLTALSRCETLSSAANTLIYRQFKFFMTGIAFTRIFDKSKHFLRISTIEQVEVTFGRGVWIGSGKKSCEVGDNVWAIHGFKDRSPVCGTQKVRPLRWNQCCWDEDLTLPKSILWDPTG